MSTKILNNKIIEPYFNYTNCFNWYDFLINLTMPLNTDIINIIETLYDKNQFKKIIFDVYNKRQIIHILGNNIQFEYTQYRIKKIIYQTYTINNFTYKKYYDVYLKKYILTKYINNFNLIKDFNIEKLIEKLDLNLIKEINIIDDKINILYDEIIIDIKHINKELYFIKYKQNKKLMEIYIEIISNRIEIDIFDICDNKMLKEFDIEYNYLNIILENKCESRILEKQNRKIIKYNNEKIIDGYYNYFKNSPIEENLLVVYKGTLNAHDEPEFEIIKYKEDLRQFHIFENKLFENNNIEKLKNIGINIPIMKNISDKDYVEQFIFGTNENLKFAVIESHDDDNYLYIYTYNNNKLSEYCIDNINKFHRITKYFDSNMKIIKEAESYGLEDNNTEITKYYFDDYKIITKSSKYNYTTYERESYFKNGKLVFLRKGFFGKLKIRVNKLSSGEHNSIINHILNQNHQENDGKNIIETQKNTCLIHNEIEKIICDDKEYKFIFSYKSLENNYGIINSVDKIQITEKNSEGKKNIIYKCSKCGHIEEKIEISENGNVTSIEKNNNEKFTIGYKATLDENGDYCITTLEIPENAKIRIDTIYKKNRTNKVKVKYIGQLFKIKDQVSEINDKFYYVSVNDLDKCMVCKEICYEIKNNNEIKMEQNKEMYLLIPCCHKLCTECYDDLSHKVCPYCTVHINDKKKIKNICKSYSFISNKICYEVGNSIEIEDFNNDKAVICGNGIHYQDEIKDTYKWFEFNEIPDDLGN
jgi:hypothetical protein